MCQPDETEATILLFQGRQFIPRDLFGKPVFPGLRKGIQVLVFSLCDQFLRISEILNGASICTNPQVFPPVFVCRCNLFQKLEELIEEFAALIIIGLPLGWI